jgi:hypothetical protein
MKRMRSNKRDLHRRRRQVGARCPKPAVKFEREANAAHASAVADQAEYDKQLLTLSAGLLAISFAFIKDIVPLPSAIHLWALYLALGLVASCMLLVLFSYQFSITVNMMVKDYWEQEASRIKDPSMAIPNEFPNHNAKRVSFLNRFNGILFAAGVVLLLIFVFTNLHHERRLSSRVQRAISTHQEELVQPKNL